MLGIRCFSFIPKVKGHHSLRRGSGWAPCAVIPGLYIFSILKGGETADCFLIKVSWSCFDDWLGLWEPGWCTMEEAGLALCGWVGRFGRPCSSHWHLCSPAVLLYAYCMSTMTHIHSNQMHRHRWSSVCSAGHSLVFLTPVLLNGSTALGFFEVLICVALWQGCVLGWNNNAPKQKRELLTLWLPAGTTGRHCACTTASVLS